MLPKEWANASVESVCSVVSVGIVVNPSHYYVAPGRGVRAFRSGNVRENAIADRKWVYLSELGNAKNKKSILVSGDVLVVRTGFAGTACVVADEYAGSNCIDVLFARPDPKKILSEYLAQITNSELGRRQVLAGQSGLAQKHLNVATYAKMSFGLPPVHEQRGVGKVLSTWDKAICKAELLLENRQLQWQALLAMTLHLPPANPSVNGDADNGGYPASVQPGIPNLPPAPAGWHRTALGQHLTEVRRHAALRADDEYRLVTVKRSRGGVELRETLTGREIKTPSQFYVRTGDFLISKRQIVHGACGIVPAELDGAVVSNEYAVLNSDGQIDLRFLRYLSESRYFQQTCFHSSIGVHVEKMIFKTERWLKWPFNIPPLPVQQRIVEVLDTARREVELIAAQIERLKQEKAALMADLLTGKRRVKLNAEAVSTP